MIDTPRMDDTLTFGDETALRERLVHSSRGVVFLVGSALTAPRQRGEPGVPDVREVIAMVRAEYEAKPAELRRFEEALASGRNPYPAAFDHLLKTRSQDHANRIIRRAVLRARLDPLGSRAGVDDGTDASCRALENDREGWALTPGVESLGALVARFQARFGTTVLTSNFDPLLEVAIRRAGGTVFRTVLHSDGRLEQTEADGCRVVHLHGDWFRSDTLHTPAQLLQPRPHLRASLAEILSQRTLVTVGYGGWDDVFTTSLAQIVRGGAANFDVLWTFYDDDSAKIRADSGAVLAALQEGVGRGRVVFYKGIDVHSLFPKLVEDARASSPSAPGRSRANGGGARALHPPGAPYDPAWYVHRDEEERRALEHLDVPGAPVTLWGPSLFGKSTMLSYLLGRVEERERGRARIVRIDLGVLLHDPRITLDCALENFARLLVREVGGASEWVTAMVADPLPPTTKLTYLMQEKILPHCGDRLVLALEGADAVCGFPFQDDFFRLLRTWCELGPTEPWSRFRLALAVSTTPMLLMRAPRTSPWNLVPPIELPDFVPEQAEALARLYGLDWHRETIEAKLMPLVGGHPFLLRAVMHEAAGAHRFSLDALLEDPTARDRLFARPLSTLLAGLEQRPKRLADGLRKILRNPRTRLDDDTYQRLSSAGFITRTASGDYRVRYKLYELHLRRLWHLPRQKQA